MLGKMQFNLVTILVCTISIFITTLRNLCVSIALKLKTLILMCCHFSVLSKIHKKKIYPNEVISVENLLTKDSR